MLLLDSCVLLWLTSDTTRVSHTARALIARHPGLLFVSPISAWEIAVKHRKGKLSLPLPADEWMQSAMRQHGLDEAPLNCRIAIDAAELPQLHADPCDRILIATARHLDLTLVTPDPLIQAYEDVSIAW